MTELLLRTELSSKQRRHAETVQRSANALLTILNDILDFSKIEAGKLELRLEECSIRGVLEETGELLAAQPHGKGLELAVEVRQEVPPLVRAYRDRLRQVVTNIAGNAVKFTQSGEVLLRASLAEQSGARVVIRFEVTDTGIGIDEASRARLFDPFYQADGSLTRKFGGTGLGLAICRNLVHLMGGEIGVESVVGKGSTFWFTVAAEVTASAGDAVHAPPVGPLGVLLVDDNRTNLGILEEILAGWEMSTVSAPSARAAMAAVRGERFDVAILDMQMPEATGLDLATSLRKDPRTAGMPLILLTSLGESQLPPEGRKLVNVILVKPVRRAELGDAIARVMGTAAPALTPKPRREFAGERVPPGDGPVILVAKDNVINQEVMREVLLSMGIDADIVENGRAALDALERRQYPVVLMDCQMPEMDEYEATRRLRERERREGKPRQPIISVTAHAVVGERQKAEDAGMDDYVTKPVDTAALRSALERFLPREAEQPDEPPLDPAAHRGRKLMELFLEHVPGQLEALGAAVTAGEDSARASAAHKLKGSCLSIGAPRMAALCKAIEAPSAGRKDAHTGEFAALQTEFERVKDRLKAELAALAPAP